MTYFETLKKYWYLVAGIVVITCVLTLVISIAQTPKYESMVQLLVIQKQAPGISAETAARSADTIANILSKMIYTSTFFEKVKDSGFDIKREFPEDPKKFKKEWSKTVDATVISETGILEIRTYDPDKYQVEQLAYAVAYVLTKEGKYYHGGDVSVEIKMVDKPITSTRPVKPNVLQNTVVGFAISLLVSLGLIFLLTGRAEEAGEVERETPLKPKKIFPEFIRPEVPVAPKEVPLPPKKGKPEIKREIPKPIKERPSEEEPYAPEKVNKWIKTGKFE